MILLLFLSLSLWLSSSWICIQQATFLTNLRNALSLVPNCGVAMDQTYPIKRWARPATVRCFAICQLTGDIFPDSRGQAQKNHHFLWPVDQWDQARKIIHINIVTRHDQYRARWHRIIWHQKRNFSWTVMVTKNVWYSFCCFYRSTFCLQNHQQIGAAAFNIFDVVPNNTVERFHYWVNTDDHIWINGVFNIFKARLQFGFNIFVRRGEVVCFRPSLVPKIWNRHFEIDDLALPEASKNRSKAEKGQPAAIHNFERHEVVAHHTEPVA